MSINLVCNEMELYQVPSTMTLAILESQKIHGWQAARGLYLDWLRETYQGVSELPAWAQENLNQHIQDILNAETLTFDLE